MANQPDISTILAALAQRPQQTPNQAPPPGAPAPGYHPGLGAPQVPTPSLGGYSLPQPSNSGSVDLSAIRPVNTGSVSIAEAIAKAKSIAADRGISYDNRAQNPPQMQMQMPTPREDPRLAGRAPYRRSRSRSRSPPRRDNFRDNYNPYRDERRDADRRDRGFNRERSMSPNPRARANFSPGPGAGPGRGPRSPPSSRGGGGPPDGDTISVKSALVGLIIGRNGENLRRVESETGARVQFIPAKEPNAHTRQCTISGPPRARDAAKREIFRVIDENGGSVPPERGPPPPRQQKPANQPTLREGENSVQIMVPDKTVGLIIGRGGETIRDLQERSGCHVNIVGENKSIGGLRPVNLIGSPAAAAIAKDMILEIVESDTRAPGTAGGPPPPQMDPRGGPPAFDPYRGAMNDRGGDKTNEDIFVPSEAVGMIIGKGGETIKEMQSTTGCKINVSQPQQPDVQRQIGLVGTREAIEEAKRAIWDKVDTVQQRDRQGGREQRAPRNDAFGSNQYSPPQQQAYGQQPMGAAPQAMPAMPGMSAVPQQATSTDPNAADPYAAYGGYQNYVALWYAALAQQQGGQGQQPQMPPQ